MNHKKLVCMNNEQLQSDPDTFLLLMIASKTVVHFWYGIVYSSNFGPESVLGL